MRRLGTPEDFGEQLKVMFELMTLAWQTDKTRVATFMMAKEVSMRTYNQIGVSDAFHPLSHHQNDPSKLDRLAKIQTWHTRMFAGFVKRLQQVNDGDGSLLDHVIILYGSNMSNSDKHNNDPVALGGTRTRLRPHQGRTAPALPAGHPARESAAHAVESRQRTHDDFGQQHGTAARKSDASGCLQPAFGFALARDNR